MAHTQKAVICTCMIFSFEANGIMIWFNKADPGFTASSKKLPSFPRNSEDRCDQYILCGCTSFSPSENNSSYTKDHQ